MATFIDSDGVLTEGDPWVLVDTHTCDQADTEITFTSQTGSTDYKKNWSQYADLILLINGRSDRSADEDYVRIKFENKASAYWVHGTYTLTAYIDSGDWVATQGDCGRIKGGNSSTDERSSLRIEMFDINSGKYKTVYSRWSQAQASTPGTGVYGFTWADTSDGMLSCEAISEIDIYLEHGDFAATTRFDLIGVLPRMIENTAVG